MPQLSKDWLTETHIDLEYKQYILLAYLTDVSQQFQKKWLYPSLAELIEHYRNLKLFRQQADSLYNSFPEDIASVNFENFKISYHKVVSNDTIMNELGKIIDFSLPRFEQIMKNGKDIYDIIEKQVQLEPIGLTPLSTDEGYMMIETGSPKELRIYEYSINLFEESGEPMRAMHTELFCTYNRTLFQTPESIKIELIKKNRRLPNPATFLFTVGIQIPFEQTYLPIAKRLLMKQLTVNGLNA